jgi:phosphoribosylaminoimidazole carboxylase
MSQYKAQLISILDNFPNELVLAPRVSSAIMVNILGGAKHNSHDRLVDLAKSMGNSSMDVYLHQYGKESKPGRKIGHITAVGYVSIDKLEALVQPLITCVDDIRKERIGENVSTSSSS